MTDLRSSLVFGMIVLMAVGVAVPPFVSYLRKTESAHAPHRALGTSAVPQPANAPRLRDRTERPVVLPPSTADATHAADRGTVRRTVLAFLEPNAITERMSALAPRAARRQPRGEQTHSVADVAQAYRNAFVTTSAQSEAELRPEVDTDQLARALALLEAVIPGEEKDTLENQLVEWTTELALLLDQLNLSEAELSAQGAEALATATPAIAKQLAAQHDELVRVLRATGKPVPESALPLDHEITPESLGRIVEQLQQAAGAAGR